jgi:PadR family transcriptional regulator PadR
MASVLNLGEFEQLILLAILRLGDDAYGVTIRREISARAGRSVPLGSAYATLGRLAEKELVRLSSPIRSRGAAAEPGVFFD